MTLRGALRDAVARLRRRPSLVLVGLCVVAVQSTVVTVGQIAQVVLTTAMRGPELTTQPYDPTLVAYLLSLLTGGVLVLTLPLLVGVFVPAREPPRGSPATLRRAAQAVRRWYRPVLDAVIRAEGVALLVGVAVAVGWYVVATAGRAVRYLVWDPAPPYPLEPVLLTLLALFAGVGVARVVLGFADLAALSERATSAEAWRVSLRFARRHPRIVVGYAVVVGVLGAITATLTAAAGAVGGDAAGALGGWGAGLLTGVVAGGAATTVVAVLQVSIFDRHAGARAGLGANDVLGVDASTWSGRVAALGTGRVVVAAVVLVAAVAGAAAVRIDETGVHQPGMEPGPADADASTTYRVAVENTVGSNHRMVFRTYNRTEGDGDADFAWVTRYDFDDRQAIVRFYDPGEGLATGVGGGGYYDTGVLAVYGGTGENWTARSGDRWTPLPAPGWAFVLDRSSGTAHSGWLPEPRVDWRVVSRNESTLVLRVTGVEAVRDAAGPNDVAGMGRNMSENSSVTVYVDRERTVVERAIWRTGTTAPRERFRHVVRVREIGSHDVTRPVALPPRRPLEWLWDALYY